MGDSLDDRDVRYLKEQGYISEKGAPLKCYCGCKEFERSNEYRDEYGVVEYQLKCINCGEKVGHWAYGYW